MIRWSEGDGGECAHLGQFHGLSCGGGGHSSDSRETGDILTRERSGEERDLNDCGLISAVGCKSDPPNRVNTLAGQETGAFIKTTNRHKR